MSTNTTTFLVADVPTAERIQAAIANALQRPPPTPTSRFFSYGSSATVEWAIKKLARPAPALLCYSSENAGGRICNLSSNEQLYLPTEVVDEWVTRFRAQPPSETETLALLAPITGLLDRLLLAHYNESRLIIEKAHTYLQQNLQTATSLSDYWSQTAQDLAKRYLQLKLKTQAAEHVTSR